MKEVLNFIEFNFNLMTTFIVIKQLSIYLSDIIWAKCGFTHMGPI